MEFLETTRKQSNSGSDISADSAGALKSITANISPESPPSSAKTSLANEQAGAHIHKYLDTTFVLFSFSCLGHYFV